MIGTRRSANRSRFIAVYGRSVDNWQTVLQLVKATARRWQNIISKVYTTIEAVSFPFWLRRIVTRLDCASYKHIYLLTYLLTVGHLHRRRHRWRHMSAHDWQQW